MKWLTLANGDLTSGHYEIIGVPLGLWRVSYELRYKGRWCASCVSTERLKYLAINHAANISMSVHSKGV